MSTMLATIKQTGVEMDDTTAVATGPRLANAVRTKWGGPALRPGERRDPESGLRVSGSAHPGARSLWRRLRDNKESMIALGGDPLWATPLGRLRLADAITATQFAAARRFAELCGRNDRYQNLTRRHAVSPAYERGHGSVDEVERHHQNGTLPAYERSARKAKKQWERAWRALPDAGREMVMAVVVLEHELLEQHYRDFAAMLKLLAASFGFLDRRVEEDGNRGGSPGDRALPGPKGLVVAR